MPASPIDSEPLAAGTPSSEAAVPQKAIPMTDIVTPNGQTVLNGHDDHHDHSHAALWASAGDHRVALQLGTEGRFNDRNHSDTMKAFADIESRQADRFNSVLVAIKEEAGRTRECLMQQKTDDLRFANLRLEIAAK